jgi:FkbM family methyltransferase
MTETGGTRFVDRATSVARAIVLRMKAATNPNRDVSVFSTLADQRLAVPGYTHSALFRSGTTDPHLFHLMSTIPVDGVVFDIGANIGEFTVLAGKVASKGQVVSFEPCPLIRPYLELNLRLNELENVTVRTEAVGDATGPSRLTFSAQTTRSSLRPPSEAEWSVDVDVVTVDAVIEADPSIRPEFVKVDVEGRELAVFHGMMRLLEGRDRPVIVFEAEGHGGASEEEVVRLLENLDYTVCEFTWDPAQRKVVGTRLAGRAPHSRSRNPNLVAVPNRLGRASSVHGGLELNIEQLLGRRP